MGHYGSAFIGKMIVSAVIHAVIYGAVWRIFRQLSTPEIIGVVVVVLAFFILTSRRRRY